jgi:hypothetical protein
MDMAVFAVLLAKEESRFVIGYANVEREVPFWNSIAQPTNELKLSFGELVCSSSLTGLLTGNPGSDALVEHVQRQRAAV